jgi:hypothetical protein
MRSFALASVTTAGAGARSRAMDNDVQGHENGAAWGERRCSSSHGHTGMSRLRTGGVVIVDELGKMDGARLRGHAAART